MRTRLILGAMMVLLSRIAVADLAAPSVPDTPAGRALGSWLAAFNNGDRTDVESFIKTQASWLNLDSVMKWQAETGGYDLLAIYTSNRTQVTFRVRAKVSPVEEVGVVTVTATNPALVTQLGTFFIPPGATFVGFQIDDATRKHVIGTSIAKLTEHYVSPEVGKAMALEITKRERLGAYSNTDGKGLAKLLTADMRAISHDKHLLVTFNPFRLPVVASDTKGSKTQPAAKDCAFDKVERLPNNVGYIKFDGFVASNACADVRSAAMAFLAGVDALIFDLRDNHGGADPDQGPDLLSYLFDQPAHLSDIYDRTTGRTTEYWIQPIGPEKQLGTIPVYVLTSQSTFSAAEYFTYNLQALKRAVVVGEVTGGGSHLVSAEPIDDRFGIRMPHARPINPITKTDWEGVGVIPDVKVSASDALATAEVLASEELHKRSK